MINIHSSYHSTLVSGEFRSALIKAATLSPGRGSDKEVLAATDWVDVGGAVLRLRRQTLCVVPLKLSESIVCTAL